MPVLAIRTVNWVATSPPAGNGTAGAKRSVCVWSGCRPAAGRLGHDAGHEAVGPADMDGCVRFRGRQFGGRPGADGVPLAAVVDHSPLGEGGGLETFQQRGLCRAGGVVVQDERRSLRGQGFGHRQQGRDADAARDEHVALGRHEREVVVVARGRGPQPPADGEVAVPGAGCRNHPGRHRYAVRGSGDGRLPGGSCTGSPDGWGRARDGRRGERRPRRTAGFLRSLPGVRGGGWWRRRGRSRGR